MPQPFVVTPRPRTDAAATPAPTREPSSLPGSAPVPRPVPTPAPLAPTVSARAPGFAPIAPRRGSGEGATPRRTVSPRERDGLPERAGGGASDERGAEDRQHPALESFRRYLDDPDVTDLFVNGGDGLFVDRGTGPRRVREWRAAERDVRELAVALIGLGGRHIDDATPCVDVRLERGMRVHAVLPPIAQRGTTISIRVPGRTPPDLDDLARGGLVDAEGLGQLESLVADRENLLITGAGGSGKTTLLSALLSRAPETDRIVTIEDVAELRPRHPHHVSLEARQPNLEGAGGVDLAQLVREALRMRPDRLVVGECRGAEVRELLSALNTGHDGGAGTLHANGLDDVPARLEALGALAGLDDRALARQVVSAIGRVVHLERGDDGRRRVTGIARPVLRDGRLAMEATP